MTLCINMMDTASDNENECTSTTTEDVLLDAPMIPKANSPTGDDQIVTDDNPESPPPEGPSSPTSENENEVSNTLPSPSRQSLNEDNSISSDLPDKSTSQTDDNIASPSTTSNNEEVSQQEENKNTPPENPQSPDASIQSSNNEEEMMDTSICSNAEDESQSQSSPVAATKDDKVELDTNTVEKVTKTSDDEEEEPENVSEDPQSPDASIQSNEAEMMDTSISTVEESQSQSTPITIKDEQVKPNTNTVEKVVKKEEVEDGEEMEEGEDLEDGEIEDDEEEEEEEVVVKVEKPKIAKKEEKPKERSPEKRSKREKSKDELDPVKKLLAEVKEKDNREREEREKRRRDKKRSHHKDEEKDKEKKDSSKKKRKVSQEEEEGGEFLFVRGASPGAGGNNENWDEVDDRRGGKRRRESDDGASPSHRHRRGHEGSDSPPRNINRPKSSGRPEPRREPKSDVICAYFMQGKCQKSSEQCTFSHDAIPPRKMELCKFWMMECCAKKEKCLYLHNDFPCKFFHTGLVCRQAENCKFSHNPLSDVTKQVLLKHIETAPKEILGDFPRLNRTGALTLINKMEAKLKGEPFVEEENNENEPTNQITNQGGGGPQFHGQGGPTDRHNNMQQNDRHHGGQQQDNRHHHQRDNRGHFGGGPQGGHNNDMGMGGGGRGRGHDRGHNERGPAERGDRRQSRWEQSQPTRGDQEKLKELMSEAGISGFYKDTLAAGEQQQQQQQQRQQMSSQGPPTFPPPLPNMQPPLMPMLPQFLLPQGGQGMPPINNPALANVLASLNIPSTTIVPPNIPNYPPPSMDVNKSNNQIDEQNKNQIEAKIEEEEPGNSIPDNLPKMQRELFRRIQQQQLKNENKVQTQEKPEPEEPEENWYSDDEEEDSKKKEELKAEINDQITSVLNQIRQQSQQQSSVNKEPETLKTFFGDTDLRSTTNSSGTDFKDVDLRTTAPMFKINNILPATEINASISSHSPLTYFVYKVEGVLDKPDYSHVRSSLTPQQILMDPRLGPRQRRSSIPAPESPTEQSAESFNSQPMSIPDATPIFDPRTAKGGGSNQNQPKNSGRGLLELPNPFVQENSMVGMNMNMNMNDFNQFRDPRAPNNNSNNPPPVQLPPNSAALNFAAALMQQWPNGGQPPMDPNLLMMAGFPFLPPQAQGQGPPGPHGQPPNQNFGNMMQNTGIRMPMRPPFMPGNNNNHPSSNNQHPQPPPASSWERFNRGQGNLSPPL